MRDILIPIARQFPEAIFYHPTRERTIALTIDDVGDPSTEIILEAIERHNQSVSNSIERVRATFLIITDFLAGKTEIIDEILKRGHEIGNHGCFDRTHADLGLPGEFDRESENTRTSSSVGNPCRSYRSSFTLDSDLPNREDPEKPLISRPS